MIYLDLDETLALAAPYEWGSDAKKTFTLEETTYFCAPRPIAKRLIEGCREIDDVRILTMGTRDYADALVAATELPFTPDQVITRDDFLVTGFTGWVYTAELEVVGEGISPDGILVDNQQPTEGFAALKMRYLGINPIRYIKIATFTGRDHSGIVKEVEDILCQIRSLKN